MLYNRKIKMQEFFNEEENVISVVLFLCLTTLATFFVYASYIIFPQ